MAVNAITTIIAAGVRVLTNTLFPLRCACCSTIGAWLCAHCRIRAPYFDQPHCPLCGAASAPGTACAACCTETQLQQLWIAAPDGAQIGALIRALKYRGGIEAAATTAALLQHTVAVQMLQTRVAAGALLLPIPLQRARQRARGYNHAEILARAFVLAHNQPSAEKIFIKHRHTAAQAKLKRAERLQNLEHAFQCVAPEQIRGRDIVLFDDVFTTGATMLACATTLRAAGAARVSGFAVTHGHPDA